MYVVSLLKMVYLIGIFSANYSFINRDSLFIDQQIVVYSFHLKKVFDWRFLKKLN